MFAGTAIEGGAGKAGYWKNGTFTPLSDGTVSVFMQAITVADGNVFTAGTGFSNKSFYSFNSTIFYFINDNSNTSPVVGGIVVK